VQQYGLNGLIVATFLAGALLIAMGLVGLGSIIRFIPYPLVVGFTSGIAVIIFSSEIKDMLGLEMGEVPAEFVEKWQAYFHHMGTINLMAVLIFALTLAIILVWPKVTRKIPGSLVAIVVATFVVRYFQLPVETIGSRFGAIKASLPAPDMPGMSWSMVQHLVGPAVTIALLGAIESLLSAVVADGMTGGNHRSNTELIAQGVANMASALFGGIPATGAIARTATNVKNGGRTPVAGIVHALVLLLILFFVGKWAVWIPMAALAGILVVVAYHMSEWQNFRSLLKGPRNDVAVLLTTFLLTVLVDLTVAIEVGMLLAILLFLQKMVQASAVKDLDTEEWEQEYKEYSELAATHRIQVFEISGPLFFGAVYKFKEAMRHIDHPPQILILRMRNVPVIDATGIKAIQEFHRFAKARNTKLILSEVSEEQVWDELRKARLLFAIGKANATHSFQEALERGKRLVEEQMQR
jgi:SulP family sulfate permease